MKKKIITTGLLVMLLLMSISTLSATGIEADENEGDEELKESTFCTCIAGGTKITMSDGTQKNIEDIKPRDEIRGYDIETGEFYSWRVWRLEKVNRGTCTIKFGNSALEITAEHPIRVKKQQNELTGWGSLEPESTIVRDPKRPLIKLQEEIKQVDENDFLFAENGEWVKITEIIKPEKGDENYEVVHCYNLLSKTKTNTYFGNGVLIYEELPPAFPYMVKFHLYQIFSKIPFLSNFKDIFVF